MNATDDLAAIILAAGKGTRMKSRRPKVMHCILGRPLVGYVIDILIRAGIKTLVAVSGHGRAELEKYLRPLAVKVAVQEEQLGTAHAVLCAKDFFFGYQGQVLIICGDTPLFLPGTLKRFVSAHMDADSDISILSTRLEDPTGYGRIIRDPTGGLKAIVEEKDAGPEDKEIKEVNTGTYLVKSTLLFDLLAIIDCNNAQGEYYLTDIVEKGLKAGLKIMAFDFAGPQEALGVNSRYQLSVAEDVLLARLRKQHMDAGVTLSMPETIYIEPPVIIEPDVFISPHVIIKGHAIIRRGSTVGAFSYLNGCTVKEQTSIAPYSKLICKQVDRLYYSCP